MNICNLQRRTASMLPGQCFAPHVTFENQAALLMVMLLVTLVLFIVAMVLAGGTNIPINFFNSSRPSVPLGNIC